MDNLTHSLVGLTLAKAGLERLSPGATTLCVLAANSPDADIAFLLGGRYTYLQNHRGITHSIIGTLTLALVLPLIFYFGGGLVARLRNRKSTGKLPGLLLASFIATATHPFLDWTNNYGIRPLLPWSGRWSYGDFVFIIDPFLWLILGGAVFLATANNRKRVALWLMIAIIPSYLVLFGPGNRGALGNATVLRVVWISTLVALLFLFLGQIGKRMGAKVSGAALIAVSIYLGGLFVIHQIAAREADKEATKIAQINRERALKVAAMPTPANPFEWLCVVETDKASYRFGISLVHSAHFEETPTRHERLEASTSPAIAEASADERAQVFLGFARFPVMRVVGKDCLSQTLVQFADLRYTEPGSGNGIFSLEVPVSCPSTGIR